MIEMGWYDYVAEEYVYMTSPGDDATAKRLLPQWPPVSGLYDCHRAQGKSILDAMIAVLEICTGNAQAKPKT